MTDSAGRALWGIWQVSIDPVSGTAEVLPARFGEFHANVRKFLEEGPCMNCLRVVPPVVPQPYGMDVTISLQHPFAGNAYYDGFDVRGIIMLEGDFSFEALHCLTTRASEGGWAILNPDGYTKIFNAVDYTLPGILGYSKGKMIPPSWPNPTNTLNPFKAFYSIGQSEEDGGRRGFSAGDVIERTYEIQMKSGEPFRFWYVVDASWVPPTGEAPYDFDDFAPEANCPEAYRFDFSVVSGELYPSGGTVKIGMDIWDHQGWSAPYDITVEMPECNIAVLNIFGPPLSVIGDRAHWEFNIANMLGGLDPLKGTEIAALATNSDPDPLTGTINGIGRFTIPVSATSNSPVVYSIDPDQGAVDTGIDNAHIVGDKFLSGCTVRLEKTGETAIQGMDVVFQDAQNVFADLNLTGAAIGTWDVVVENPGGLTGVLPDGFTVMPPSGCNDLIHDNYLGSADFGGGTHMPALDACFVHDTGSDADGELMAYISGFAGTVCLTYNVDTLDWTDGHGLGSGWGNPHILSWPTPDSIDIAEESGRFFIVWSDTKSIVEVWNRDGKLAGQTDASNSGQVFSLDTDGHYGFWDGFFPEVGFAPGIKHFTPDGPEPGTLVEKVEDAISLPEVWGTPVELICIPDDTLLVLTGSNNGKVRAYDISVSPPVMKGEITDIFSGELDFGKLSDKPCDMEAEWSDPTYAYCRIIVWGNLLKGDGELVRIDATPSVLAGPINVEGHWDSLAINPHTLNVTLWPLREGSAGAYALVEVPPGW
jgi:hypothetical protein